MRQPIFNIFTKRRGGIRFLSIGRFFCSFGIRRAR